jgi:hypothetical protein
VGTKPAHQRRTTPTETVRFLPLPLVPSLPRDDSSQKTVAGAAPILYLPLKTPILLTTRKVPRLRRVPPPKEVQPGVSSSTANAEAGPSSVATPQAAELVPNDVPRQAVEPQKPLFRRLEDGELLPPRGARHAAPPEVRFQALPAHQNVADAPPRVGGRLGRFLPPPASLSGSP